MSDKEPTRSAKMVTLRIAISNSLAKFYVDEGRYCDAYGIYARSLVESRQVFSVERYDFGHRRFVKYIHEQRRPNYGCWVKPNQLHLSIMKQC